MLFSLNGWTIQGYWTSRGACPSSVSLWCRRRGWRWFQRFAWISWIQPPGICSSSAFDQVWEQIVDMQGCLQCSACPCEGSSSAVSPESAAWNSDILELSSSDKLAAFWSQFSRRCHLLICRSSLWIVQRAPQHTSWSKFGIGLHLSQFWIWLWSRFSCGRFRSSRISAFLFDFSWSFGYPEYCRGWK